MDQGLAARGAPAGLPKPGDYMVTEIGRESILIVRQADGGVARFYNVCQHRGNRLRDCGLGTTGESRSFTCAYHHWEYELDGTFRRIPDIDTFRRRARRGLREVQVRHLGGLRWYTLNEPPRIAAASSWGYPPGTWTRTTSTAWCRRATSPWSGTATGKTSVDAFNESYHVQGIHPQLLWYLHDLDIQIDCYERHSRYLIPFGTVSPRVRQPPSIPEPVKIIMSLAGMDPADTTAHRQHPHRRAEAQARAWQSPGHATTAPERRPAHR